MDYEVPQYQAVQLCFSLDLYISSPKSASLAAGSLLEDKPWITSRSCALPPFHFTC